MTGCMDKGIVVDCVYLGFSKVFDMVSYTFVIAKLERQDWLSKMIKGWKTVWTTKGWRSVVQSPTGGSLLIPEGLILLIVLY